MQELHKPDALIVTQIMHEKQSNALICQYKGQLVHKVSSRKKYYIGHLSIISGAERDNKEAYYKSRLRYSSFILKVTRWIIDQYWIPYELKYTDLDLKVPEINEFYT
jgi:hypothetical protein